MVSLVARSSEKYVGYSRELDRQYELTDTRRDEQAKTVLPASTVYFPSSHAVKCVPSSYVLICACVLIVVICLSMVTATHTMVNADVPPGGEGRTA